MVIEAIALIVAVAALVLVLLIENRVDDLYNDVKSLQDAYLNTQDLVDTLFEEKTK